MFVTIYRTSKFALQNFWRNLWLSIITILILTLTVFLISLVFTLNVISERAITALEEKIDIDIYFVDTAKEQDIVAAQLYLQDIPEVRDVRYISSEEALRDFKDTNVDNAELQTALDELDDNPLPASLVVQAYELDDYEVIIEEFENSEYDALAGDKNFSDHQLVINRLSSITKRVYQAGIVISGIFIIISMILMFNTIRLAIYAHREELGIMKLVGATNWFIRAPFMLEGVLYAIGSSVLASILLWLTIVAAAPYVNAFFVGYNFELQLFFYDKLGIIIAVQFVFALVLAVGSSMISMGRYLRV